MSKISKIKDAILQLTHAEMKEMANDLTEAVNTSHNMADALHKWADTIKVDE